MIQMMYIVYDIIDPSELLGLVLTKKKSFNSMMKIVADVS
jgi:hypothetical protein